MNKNKIDKPPSAPAPPPVARKSRRKEDPLGTLRKQLTEEFVPVFRSLLEKYGPAGILMKMDASDFLEGGREITFEFALGDVRFHLVGTVTTGSIAFHETREAPHLKGRRISAPMLRLKGLGADLFREFVCERLTALLREANQKP